MDKKITKILFFRIFFYFSLFSLYSTLRVRVNMHKRKKKMLHLPLEAGDASFEDIW